MNNKRKIDTVVVLVAIICIAILEGLAMWQGIDGRGFGIAVAAIAGLAGFTIKSIVG